MSDNGSHPPGIKETDDDLVLMVRVPMTGTKEHRDKAAAEIKRYLEVRLHSDQVRVFTQVKDDDPYDYFTNEMMRLKEVTWKAVPPA